MLNPAPRAGSTVVHPPSPVAGGSCVHAFAFNDSSWPVCGSPVPAIECAGGDGHRAAHARRADGAHRARSVAEPVALPPTGSRALTQVDVEAWLDGFMPYAIGRGGIPGAVVVVVKDGQILTQKGYGFSDVAKRTPVDPATTLFRPGSVSKLVTWTAVMQLVEQGKLDLDADINKYLDFPVPGRDGKAITMRHIMTHTTGMEEIVRGLITSETKDALALDAYLKRWVPTRIFAPGETPAYSNYATTLAGYIVQRVSGQSFDDYVDQHIFAPLDMKHSSFRQPLPAALQPLMSKGYKLGTDKPQGYEIVNPSPAGNLAASGADMGRFMIAHLQNGSLWFQANPGRGHGQGDARNGDDLPAAVEPDAAGLL